MTRDTTIPVPPYLIALFQLRTMARLAKIPSRTARLDLRGNPFTYDMAILRQLLSRLSIPTASVEALSR